MTKPMMATAPEKILDRVGKLLRLAESANDNEAANAAAAAQRLMSEHSITIEMLGDADETDEGAVRDRGPMGQWDALEERRRSAWRWSLAWGIAKANGCKPWRRIARNGRLVQTFIGRESDGKTCAYLYRYLVIEIDRRAKLHGGRGRSWILAYRKGIVTTLAKRLANARDEAADRMRAAADTSTALVRVNDAIARIEIAGEQAAVYMGDAGLKYGRARASTVDSRGYAAGRADGRTVSLGGSAALGAGAKAAVRGGGQ